MDRRPFSSARDIAPAAMLAIVVAAVACVTHRGPAPLSPAPPCFGLFDLIAIGVARTFPSAPLGDWLLHMNAALLALALGAVTIALYVWYGVAVAGAVGLALALGGSPAPSRLPFDPVAYVVALGTIVALTGDSRRARAVAVAGALVTIAIHPCLPRSFSEWTQGWLTAATSAGPYALGLAMLGAFSLCIPRPRHLLPIAYVVLSTLFATNDATSVRVFAPVFVGLWICIGAGVHDIFRRANGPAGRTAAAVLAVLLLVFQIPRLHPSSPAPPTFGVERLSSDDIEHLFSVLPDDASLAEEDSSVAILIKSAGDAPRGGRRLFALPWAQSRLIWRGFRMTEADLTGVTGVASVTPGGACVRVTRRWVEIPRDQFGGASVMSVVRDRRSPEHALIVYVASDEPFRPSVLELEPGVRTGFTADTYTLALPADRDLLDTLTRDDRLVSVLNGPLGVVASRIELWRSNTVPAVLPIQLEHPPARIFARSTTTSDSDLICPSFPYDVHDVDIQR